MKSIISLYALCIMTAQAVQTDSEIESQVDVMAMIVDTSEIEKDHCCFFYDTDNYMIDEDFPNLHRYEVCSDTNPWGELLENAESLLDGHPFNDSIMSVRCGPEVGTTLCIGTYNLVPGQSWWDFDTYSCVD